MARKLTFQDEEKPERPFGPSKAEQTQTVRMIVTCIAAAIVLGVGLVLRFTVYADAFKPKTFTPPVATPSPDASASPSPSPSPTP